MNDVQTITCRNDSSAPPSSPSTRAISEPTRSARFPTLVNRIFAGLVLLVGLGLLLGGLYLATLGGSLYYLLAGVAYLIAGVLLWRREARGLQVLHRWTMRPYLGAIPVAAAVGTWLFLGGTFRRRDDRPFLLATGIFSAAFAAVAVSFWPYMIPYSLTVDQAASPLESTRFMFWGAGLVALPLTLAYTLFVYHVFRGKVVAAADYE